MADWGLNISKSNVDVGTANTDTMIMTSKYPVFKLQASGSGTMTKSAGASGGTVTIAHNLGYVPVCYVYGNYQTDSGTVMDRFALWSRHYSWGVEMYDRHNYYADTANLYIVYQTDYYTADLYYLKYNYHIFYDEEA